MQAKRTSMCNPNERSKLVQCQHDRNENYQQEFAKRLQFVWQAVQEFGASETT